MQEFRVKVTREQNAILQSKLFEVGVDWIGDSKEIRHNNEPFLYIVKAYKSFNILYGDDDYNFKNDRLPELTFSEALAMIKKDRES